MKLWGSKEESRTFELVLDVRSASVAASIVAFGGEVPEMLYTQRAPITLEDPTKDSDVLVTKLTATLSQILEKVVREGVPFVAEKHGAVHLKQVTCVLGAPWYESAVEEIVVKQEKPFVMTKKRFDTLLEEKAHAQQQKTSGKQLIEHDVTHVVINGYELEDPFNKKTTEMSISFYASFVSKATIDAITASITKTMHHVHVRYRTYPMVLFTTLRDMFWNVDRFTFFDISGLMTEIGVVERGSVTHLLSIPFGTQHLLQEVKSACGISEAIAASAVATLARGEVPSSCNPEVLEAFTRAQKQWMQQIMTIVDSEKITLPQRVFVAAEQAVLPLTKQALSTADVRKNVFATDQELQLVLLAPDHLRQYAAFSLEDPSDTFTILTAVFLQATK